MAYDAQTTYNKFNSKGCDCEDQSTCGCPEKEKCGCCPVGLVSVEDSDGKNIGCLSPNDAQEYMAKTYKCQPGYIRVLSETGVFLGCLTPDEYAAYVAALA
jgi:hypothetical protein